MERCEIKRSERGGGGGGPEAFRVLVVIEEKKAKTNFVKTTDFYGLFATYNNTTDLDYN